MDSAEVQHEIGDGLPAAGAKSDVFLNEMREAMMSLAPLIRRLSTGAENVAKALGTNQTWGDLENRLRLLSVTTQIANQVAAMGNFIVMSPDVLDGKLATILTPESESQIVVPK